VLQAQLVRMRRQTQHVAAEDLARAAPGNLAIAAPVDRDLGGGYWARTGSACIFLMRRKVYVTWPAKF